MTSEEMIVKVAEHEQRIEALEAADRKHVEFRKEYYQDREERIRREARLDVKLDNICADIKKLLTWQETQTNKPVKKWEGTVDTIWKLLLGAVVALVLSKIGVG